LTARRMTSDNDKPRLSTLFGRPKISCFDPLLTTVRTPYATQPFLPLLHPKSRDRRQRTTWLTPPRSAGPTVGGPLHSAARTD
jgi:hypothetical protein